MSDAAGAVLRAAESDLFARLAPDEGPAAQVPAVFVLGSPRTGSTRLYQAMAQFLRLPYFPNLANDAFPLHPVIAAPLLRAVWPTLEVTLDARYGKTVGPFQPSEASAVMTHWCGGGHPSAAVSPRVLPGQEGHLVRTLATYHALFGAPPIIKNAWNCFRVASIAGVLPAAHFVWIRRDITASALSDLAARYVTGGGAEAWNSATPANLDELRRLPYWAQVVENQYEFAVAVRAGLDTHAPHRHSVVWFEDLVADPTQTLRDLAGRIDGPVAADRVPRVSIGRKERTDKPLRPGDEAAVRAYVDQHAHRLRECRHTGGR